MAEARNGGAAAGIQIALAGGVDQIRTVARGNRRQVGLGVAGKDVALIAGHEFPPLSSLAHARALWVVGGA